MESLKLQLKKTDTLKGQKGIKLFRRKPIENPSGVKEYMLNEDIKANPSKYEKRVPIDSTSEKRVSPIDIKPIRKEGESFDDYVRRYAEQGILPEQEIIGQYPKLEGYKMPRIKMLRKNFKGHISQDILDESEKIARDIIEKGFRPVDKVVGDSIAPLYRDNPEFRMFMDNHFPYVGAPYTDEIKLFLESYPKADSSFKTPLYSGPIYEDLVSEAFKHFYSKYSIDDSYKRLLTYEPEKNRNIDVHYKEGLPGHLLGKHVRDMESGKSRIELGPRSDKPTVIHEYTHDYLNPYIESNKKYEDYLSSRPDGSEILNNLKKLGNYHRDPSEQAAYIVEALYNLSNKGGYKLGEIMSPDNVEKLYKSIKEEKGYLDKIVKDKESLEKLLGTFIPMKRNGGSIKSNMKCGQVKKSTRPGKKIMKKYCINGKEKLVHAGAKGYSDYTKYKDSKRRANFHSRHNCSEAKKGTPKHLACTELWKNGGQLSIMSHLKAKF